MLSKKRMLTMRQLSCWLLIGVLFWSCSSSDDPNPSNPIEVVDNDPDPDPIEVPVILGFLACDGGFAGTFACNNINLMSNIPLSIFNAQRGSDSWGWVDPSNSREYALMGLNNGTAFVDITSPSSPMYLGKLPSAAGASNWRDIKVYNNYAFIVSEAANHGLQVFDLTKLRGLSGLPIEFTADAILKDFGSAHNIVINQESGYAYVVGADNFEGGPLFINIQDPLAPILEGGYAEGDYSHDAQVVTYNGPDTDYSGAEIFIGSNEDEVVIVNITDKVNPVTIATISYDNVGYTHQGWFTEDQRYFILGDELDEVQIGTRSRTLIFDFQDLDNPIQHFTYLGATFAVDHNGYVKGDTFYLANYTAGLRLCDLSTLEAGTMTETAFFDTFPDNDDPMFDGVWSVYPYLPSNNIIVSDISGGLFIVRRQ